MITRTSYAEYPASPGRPAYRHDDLMVIYADESGAIHADYYDNEGHVIRYAVAVSEGVATFVSDPVKGAPRYRLTYALAAPAQPGAAPVLEGRFEIAPPGKPEAFAAYLTWTSRRVAAPKPE